MKPPYEWYTNLWEYTVKVWRNPFPRANELWTAAEERALLDALKRYRKGIKVLTPKIENKIRGHVATVLGRSKCAIDARLGILAIVEKRCGAHQLTPKRKGR